MSQRSREEAARERFSKLEEEITGILEGKISIDSLPVNPGKKLDDFARDIEYGKVPSSYIEKTFVLAQKLADYCRGGVVK